MFKSTDNWHCTLFINVADLVQILFLIAGNVTLASKRKIRVLGVFRSLSKTSTPISIYSWRCGDSTRTAYTVTYLHQILPLPYISSGSSYNSSTVAAPAAAPAPVLTSA